jgi:hypothetical protein
MSTKTRGAGATRFRPSALARYSARSAIAGWPAGPSAEPGAKPGEKRQSDAIDGGLRATNDSVRDREWLLPLCATSLELLSMI